MLLVSLAQSEDCVGMISLMNGAVVSIVHVRLGGVVDGFVQM